MRIFNAKIHRLKRIFSCNSRIILNFKRGATLVIRENKKSQKREKYVA